MGDDIADDLLPADLPSSRDLLERGKARGTAIEVESSRYVRTRGFATERAWKEHARQSGVVTTYINLGYKSWTETAEAINDLNARGEKLGYSVDRVALIADRRMGLPADMRDAAIEETGLMLNSEEDWLGTGRDVDAQCEFADHNLNSPAAIENTALAMRSGITYIGNLATNSYKYPDWPDDVTRFARTVEALGMVSAHPDKFVVENYADDGFAGSFHDVATMLGWAMLQRELTENVIGVAQCQTFGSQWSDPLLKQAYALALQAIDPHKTPVSYTHGDTNSFAVDDSLNRNAAVAALDAYYTAQRELSHPTGAAVHVTPASEAIRIPTIDDLVQTLTICGEVIRRAQSSPGLVNWPEIQALRDRILEGGRRVHRRMREGLPVLGIDVDDPLKLLLGTALLGAAKLEELFAVGEPDRSYPRGFKPVVMSEVLRRLLGWRDEALARIQTHGGLPDLAGVRIITGSGDIHEYGLFVVNDLLERCGARVTTLGTSVGAAEIAKIAREAAAEAVAISTYNGMALEFGCAIRDELRDRGMTPPIFLGGRLTEDRGGEHSVDVSADLRREGIYGCASAEDMLVELRPALSRVANGDQ